MPLHLEVKGTHANFKAKESHMITSFEFKYSVPNSRYAKGYKDNRELIIKGSISRTLEIEPIRTHRRAANAYIYDQPILNQLRKWAKTEYKGNRDEYYHNIKITAIHANEVIREITFPDAFVKDYTEDIDTSTGDGTYTLTLMQKLDKRINISIEPFNEIHPTLSDINRQREEARERKKQEKRKEQKDANIALNAGVAPSLTMANTKSDNEALNSPYWVQERHLAADRIITAQRNISMFEDFGSSTLLNPLNTIPARTTLEVIKARRVIRGTRTINLSLLATNVEMWYMVEYSGRTGWLPDIRNNIQFSQADTEQRNNRIIMVQSPADIGNITMLNNIAQVWGNGHPSRPTGGFLTNAGQGAGGRGSFAGVTSVSNPESGTAQVGNSNNRGLVDGSVVTIERLTANEMELSRLNDVNLPDDVRRNTDSQGRIWVRISNWEVGVPKTENSWLSLTESQRLFVATIASEAIGESALSQRAVGHVIMNRVDDNVREWRNLNTVTSVIEQPWAFTGAHRREPQFMLAMDYLDSRTGYNQLYENLINNVLPVYNRATSGAVDITGGALLFFSPRSMDPRGSLPNWNFSQLQEIFIDKIPSDSFRFFIYR